MAKRLASTAATLSALIAEVEAEAYARGRADARNELLEALSTGKVTKRQTQAERGGRAAKATRRTRGRGRAPRGSVRRFVERVLGEHPGSTVDEIVGRAADDIERSIKASSIRVELRNGRAQQRYLSNNRRWSLAPADAGIEEDVSGAGGEDTPTDRVAVPTETAAEGKEDGGKLGLSW